MNIVIQKHKFQACTAILCVINNKAYFIHIKGYVSLTDYNMKVFMTYNYSTSIDCPFWLLPDFIMIIYVDDLHNTEASRLLL